MARRVTQEPVEVPLQVTGASVNRRLTQEAVEAPLQVTGASVNRRLTQEAVEAGLKATGASVNRRVTQVVLEVPTTQPVHPFGEPPFIADPPWSPAYIQEPVESQAITYASYFGVHTSVLRLGERRVWIKTLRR